MTREGVPLVDCSRAEGTLLDQAVAAWHTQHLLVPSRSGVISEGFVVYVLVQCTYRSGHLAAAFFHAL